jgi:microcin C transport system substrate-binding protein
LVAATKALDRVLLWNFYVVPQWTYGKQRTARWDRFGHPDTMPQYGASAFPTVWWWDSVKAAKVSQRS